MEEIWCLHKTIKKSCSTHSHVMNCLILQPIHFSILMPTINLMKSKYKNSLTNIYLFLFIQSLSPDSYSYLHFIVWIIQMINSLFLLSTSPLKRLQRALNKNHVDIIRTKKNLNHKYFNKLFLSMLILGCVCDTLIIFVPYNPKK